MRSNVIVSGRDSQWNMDLVAIVDIAKRMMVSNTFMLP